MELIKKANSNIELVVSQPAVASKTQLPPPTSEPPIAEHHYAESEDSDEDVTQQTGQRWNQFSHRQITEAEVRL